MSDTNVSQAYAPYRKEALYCLIIDLIIALSLTLLLLLAGAGWFLLGILPLFCAGTLLLNYRTYRRIRKEIGEEAFEELTVEVTDIREDRSLAGWGGIIKEGYPKNLHVLRCKLICRGADGQKFVLLSVMSEQKQRLLRESIDRKQLTACRILCGKYSRILLHYEESGELFDTLNRKF
ncbi:MAG: hypothetical protein IJW99_11865 [Clostridia bacterium]|nr:hypothetical protein [Clostridia bacterium]